MKLDPNRTLTITMRPLAPAEQRDADELAGGLVVNIGEAVMTRPGHPLASFASTLASDGLRVLGRDEQPGMGFVVAEPRKAYTRHSPTGQHQPAVYPKGTPLIVYGDREIITQAIQAGLDADRSNAADKMLARAVLGAFNDPNVQQ